MTVRARACDCRAAGDLRMTDPIPTFPPSFPQRHSGLGIASLVIAIVSFISAVLLLVVAYAVATSGDVDANETSPVNYVLGGWIFGTGVLSLTGIVFGIGGLLQKERRKKLAAVGLVLNVVLPIGLMFILVMAMTLAPRDGVASSGARHATRQASSVVLHEDDTPRWKSPAARVFQLATAAMASAVVFFIQRRRSASAKSPGAAVEPCPRCGKPLPAVSGFCRRCGMRRAGEP
jgi:hypothetical protein